MEKCKNREEIARKHKYAQNAGKRG
jgi:hypothetical protein